MAKIIPLQNLEDNRNKVTIIDETVNDEQYPSAKAVYDSLKKIDLVTFRNLKLTELEKQRGRDNLGVSSAVELYSVRDTILHILHRIVSGEEVITFVLNDRNNFTTNEMSWKDWCDSDYNSLGFYYDSNVVYDEAGDRIYEVNRNAPDGVGYNVSPTSVIRKDVTYATR